MLTLYRTVHFRTDLGLLEKIEVEQVKAKPEADFELTGAIEVVDKERRARCNIRDFFCTKEEAEAAATKEIANLIEDCKREIEIRVCQIELLTK